MIKLSASVSKKVPVPDVEFSSQSYSAGMEIEIASGTGRKELQERLRELYGLMEKAVDQQLQARQQGPDEDKAAPARAGKQRGRQANGRKNEKEATQAQVNAILAIARDRGIKDKQLEAVLERDYGAASPSALSIRQASRLIDILKNGME